MRLEKMRFEQINIIIKEKPRYGFDYSFWDYNDLYKYEFMSFYIGDIVVGLIGYLIDNDGKEVEIMIMEVPDKYRKQGHGTNIIKMFLSYVKNDNIQQKLKVASLPDAVTFWNKIFDCDCDINEDALTYYSKEIK